MSQTRHAPLGGFEQRLLGELRTVVEMRGTQQGPMASIAERSSRARWARVAARRYLAGVAVLALIACVAVLISLSGPQRTWRRHSRSSPGQQPRSPATRSPAS